MDYSRYASEHHLDVKINTGMVAVVTMSRPEKRNAVNPALHVGLERLLPELGVDPDVRAIVLTGAGTAFCAGGDFSPGGGATPGDFGAGTILRGPKYLVQGFANCEAPIIAAVNGPAAGLGATIALMCDVIYMADTARIGDTHVNMGLVAGDGGAVIWPMLIGPHRAKELLMSGQYLSGPDAAKMGLVNHCVPAASLMEEAMAYATKLAQGPSTAIRLTKMAINRQVWHNINTVLEFSLAAEALSSKTEDCKEAILAFQQKRSPKFVGR